jgi:hypothetical protein
MEQIISVDRQQESLIKRFIRVSDLIATFEPCVRDSKQGKAVAKYKGISDELGLKDKPVPIPKSRVIDPTQIQLLRHSRLALIGDANKMGIGHVIDELIPYHPIPVNGIITYTGYDERED